MDRVEGLSAPELRKGCDSVERKPERELFGEEPVDDWEFDVWLMARRAALLYHFMASAIVRRLGEEEGMELVREAVWEYGRHCGRVVREALEERGLPATAENFSRIPDLPSRGWRRDAVTLPDGKEQDRITLCPLARTWAELGEDTALARLYCFVDQAKIDGYSCGELECVHAHNVLDGDDFCEIVFRPAGSGGDSDGS